MLPKGYPIPNRQFFDQPSISQVITIYNSIFGTGSVVFAFYILVRVFEIFVPYVSPRGISGIVYFGIHTTSYLLILSLAGVLLMKILILVRKYVLFPWDLVTPPFRTALKSPSEKPTPGTIRRASIRGGASLIIGCYIAFIFPMLAFVPWRYGYADLGGLSWGSLPVSLLKIIARFPIIGDLLILGDFVASPNQMGYFLISIPMIGMLAGLWNIFYLFRNRRFILEEFGTIPEYYPLLLKLVPHVGKLLFLLILWQFWPRWL